MNNQEPSHPLPVPPQPQAAVLPPQAVPPQPQAAILPPQAVVPANVGFHTQTADLSFPVYTTQGNVPDLIALMTSLHTTMVHQTAILMSLNGAVSSLTRAFDTLRDDVALLQPSPQQRRRRNQSIQMTTPTSVQADSPRGILANLGTNVNEAETANLANADSFAKTLIYSSTRNICTLEREYLARRIRDLSETFKADKARAKKEGVTSIAKIIERFIKPINPVKYGAINHSRYAEWLMAYVDIKDKKEKEKEKDKSNDSVVVVSGKSFRDEAELDRILREDLRVNITSVTHCHQIVELRWCLPSAPPCRSTVHSFLTSKGWKPRSFEEIKISSEETARRQDLFRDELGYLISKYDLFECPEMIINLDETSVRIRPQFMKYWLKEGQPRQIKERVTLSLLKDHTTMVAAVSAGGTMLPPQVNWLSRYRPKGPKRSREEGEGSTAGETVSVALNRQSRRKLKPMRVLNSSIEVPDADLDLGSAPKGPRVRQFVQTKTHWSSTVSLDHYVDDVIWPHVQQARADQIQREFGAIGGRNEEQLREIKAKWEQKKWLVVLDCAPIHISAEFRAAFDQKWAPRGGVLVFIPPCCTGTLQPLDIGIFGPFKQAFKARHVEIVTKGRYENLSPEDKSTRFINHSREARAVMLQSINHALAAVPRRAILQAWCEAIGATTPPKKKATKEAAPDFSLNATLQCIQVVLNNRGVSGKARFEKDAEERREWFKSLKETPKLQAPKEHGSFPYMFFYGTVGDGEFERNAYWYEAVCDQLEDPLEDKHWADVGGAGCGLTAAQALQRDAEDFESIFADLSRMDRELEEKGRLLDAGSESEPESDTASDEEEANLGRQSDGEADEVDEE